MMVKDLGRVALLFDFYGPLLTDRQQALLRSYYLEDLSLGEIAAEEGVSRQAVHDQVRRAELALGDIEVKLGLVREHEHRLARLQALQQLLQAVTSGPAVATATSAESGPAPPALAAALKPALQVLTDLIALEGSSGPG